MGAQMDDTTVKIWITAITLAATLLGGLSILAIKSPELYLGLLSKPLLYISGVTVIFACGVGVGHSIKQDIGGYLYWGGIISFIFSLGLFLLAFEGSAHSEKARKQVQG
jgi:hypothetical protein